MLFTFSTLVSSEIFVRSPEVCVNRFEQFVEHCFRFCFLAAAQRFSGAVTQVIAHQVAGDTAERFLDAGDLRDDVGTVAIFFDHFLEAANLAFDAAEAFEIRILKLRIDTDSFASFGAEGAGAIGAGNVLIHRMRGGSFGRHKYPLGLYIPLGPMACQMASESERSRSEKARRFNRVEKLKSLV